MDGGRDARGRFLPGHRWASEGGKARARKLTKAERRAIARKGFQGLVDRHFAGDVEAAKKYIGLRGAYASDAVYRDGNSAIWPKFKDPGPLPS